MDPSSSSNSSNKRKRDLDFYNEPRYKRPKFDVFVNYAPGDIGNGFASHLKRALGREGFTICDHTQLPKGQDEGSELLKAIEDSEIYLLVFSSKYASSVKCLEEFAHIMESYPRFKHRKVLPVFFNVELTDVKHQQGPFLDAFKDHETKLDPNRVQNWREALREAGHLSGLPFQNGDEAEFVHKIVKEVRNMQNPQQLCNVSHLVGIESRAQDIISALRLGEQTFTIVAVLGLSGTGKSACVKAVYDMIAPEFDTSCFIQDIHSYRNREADLQKDVISCLSGNDTFIARHNDGAARIQKLMRSRKALLVLDDVRDSDQLEALITDSPSFHCRSRIIVTTINKQSLSCLSSYTPYNVRLLDYRESFQLFTGLTFGEQDNIEKNFVDEIVWRAGGIPLVLKVWSRHFRDNEKKLWPSMLETLKRIPHQDTQKKLRIIYDLLPKRAQKLFLDIACFFDGMDKDLVVMVLQDEDFFPDFEIQNLVHKFLVKDEDSWEVSLHDVIREMGREVVRQEDEDEPGNRTRLMSSRDVVHVLENCSGTDSVRSILLDEAIKEEATVELKTFKKMSNLRFIRLNNDNLNWSCSSNDDDMSACFSFKHLKYLDWWFFPCKSLDKIDMANVVVIRLHFSKLERLWEGANKSLKNLKILDVSCSYSLTKTGSFIGLENLEELHLSICKNLEELDSSIGCLEKLVSLNLANCENLVNLPESFSNLSQLKELYIRECSKLQLLPPLPSQLRKIDAAYCRSLDVIPYDSMQKAYIFPSNPFKESLMINEVLVIYLSGKEVPEWCTYRNNNGNVLSFVAPIQFHHTKICGIILSATSDDEDDYKKWVYPTIYNKTKGTSHSFGDSTHFYCSMLVMFYPLNDTTLVVEAGDTVQIEYSIENSKSIGWRFVYEDDVVDSRLVLKDVRKPTLSLSLLSDDDIEDDDNNDDDLDPELVLKDVRKPATLSLFPLSSEIMTGNSIITELNDEEVCPFPVRDEEYTYYDFLPMVS